MPFSSMPLPVQVGTKQVTPNELREQIARHTHSIAGLGAEIVQHHLAIQQKSEHLNSLVPVGRLPFEVLSDIFMLQLNMTSLGGEECQASCGEMRQYRHVHPLIPITHVCHYWRAVALQTLRLWSVITSLPQMECLEELLRRSRQLPLDVNVGHLSSAFYRIFTERHRIQSINFMSPTHWILPDVFTIPDGSSAPLLRSLVFSNAVASHSYDWTHILAHCKLPALVHLKIVACRIKWTCNVFGPNLTRLVIWNAGRTMQPTLKSTLQALELMPLLEHIELTDLLCFEQLDSEQLGAITNQVHLQYLKRLQLSDYGVACALFLEHLSFSPSTNMTLCLHSMHSKQELGNLAAPIVKKSTGTILHALGTLGAPFLSVVMKIE